MAHIYGIECFWSLLKDRYIDVYQYRYVNRFPFLHNNLHFINMTINHMVDSRLTQKDLSND